jgi:uncharacterized protein YqjF (DUF2071 family)
MNLPVIQGIIRRRILVNFRVDPAVVQTQLPGAFSPKLHAGSAIAGICLIRLEQIRPKGLPPALGISSENAAHRIAVTWNDGGTRKEGVFIPRRDTGSLLNHLAGGRLFPGEHHHADFQVNDTRAAIDFQMRSRDDAVTVRVRGAASDALPATSKFATLTEASEFFQPGSLGYSVTAAGQRLDGLSLKTRTWKIDALEVSEVFSSYFADETKFPAGSVEFDCALIMRDIEHEWHSEPEFPVS